MTTPELKVSIGFASDKGIKSDNEDFFGSLIPRLAAYLQRYHRCDCRWHERQ